MDGICWDNKPNELADGTWRNAFSIWNSFFWKIAQRGAGEESEFHASGDLVSRLTQRSAPARGDDS
jgi:hypothetical protein